MYFLAFCHLLLSRDLLFSNYHLCHLIEINDTEIFGDVQSFLKDLDVLIINIPPKMKSTPNNKYLDKIKLLDNEIKAHTIY